MAESNDDDESTIENNQNDTNTIYVDDAKRMIGENETF